MTSAYFWCHIHVTSTSWLYSLGCTQMLNVTFYDQEKKSRDTVNGKKVSMVKHLPVETWEKACDTCIGKRMISKTIDCFEWSSRRSMLYDDRPLLHWKRDSELGSFTFTQGSWSSKNKSPKRSSQFERYWLPARYLFIINEYSVTQRYCFQRNIYKLGCINKYISRGMYFDGDGWEDVLITVIACLVWSWNWQWCEMLIW